GRKRKAATRDPGQSFEPDPVTGTEAASVHDSEPPVTTGAVGAVRSIMTVFAAPSAAGIHELALPAVSRLRSWTSVSPSAETVAVAPAWAADQVVPASVDVRN